MKDHRKRLPVSKQIRKGLEEALLHVRDEITLKTTVLERPDPPPEVGAEELTRLRLERGMSQAMFAQVLNVATRTVQSWEQGARKPSHAALRLIQVFRHDPSGLLEIVGMSAPEDQASGRKRAEGVRKPSRSRQVGTEGGPR